MPPRDAPASLWFAIIAADVGACRVRVMALEATARHLSTTSAVDGSRAEVYTQARMDLAVAFCAVIEAAVGGRLRACGLPHRHEAVISELDEVIASARTLPSLHGTTEARARQVRERLVAQTGPLAIAAIAWDSVTLGPIEISDDDLSNDEISHDEPEIVLPPDWPDALRLFAAVALQGWDEVLLPGTLRNRYGPRGT